MKQRILKITAVFLAVILLAGCTPRRTTEEPALKFSDATYVRPDVQAMEDVKNRLIDFLPTATSPNQLISLINMLFEAYDDFYTNQNLAMIHYDLDMSSAYWQTEYEFCTNNAAQVEVILDEMYRALAACSLREKLEAGVYFGEGFFDAYDGESPYDEGYMALADEEARLENDYYDLCAQAADMDIGSDAFYETYAMTFAQLYADLIAVRQEMAAYFGYDSYPQLAYDMYYYREYTPQQTARYMQQLAQELSPLYSQTMDLESWKWGRDASAQQDVFLYVEKVAHAMGGTVREAFRRMEQGELYDISSDSNKFDGGYEVYLTSYQMPFVFLKTYGENYDKLSFAHEFGHFAHDYICQGSYATVDVSEVMSQAMEYLSTLYTEDSRAESYKLLDGLSTMVEEACYTLFELRAYELEGDELSAQSLMELYEQTCSEFGLTWEVPLGFTTIQHYYAYPMYVSSYVYTCDVAFQIYQQEKEQKGDGLKTLERCLNSHDVYLVEFAQTYGLESPFKEGRLKAIRLALEEALK